MNFDQLTPAELAGRRVQLMDLYVRCFSEPPWSEQLPQVYAEVIDQHLAQPGLVIIAALDGDDLAGIIYGCPSPAEYPDDAFHQSVPVSARHRMVAPAVGVNELMVHPDHQRKGIGRELLTRYMKGHSTGWLVTHPDAQARGLYDSAGWQPGEIFDNHRGEPRIFYFHQA